MGGGRGWLAVGVMAVLERVGEVDVVLGEVRRRNAETLRDVGRRGEVDLVLAAPRLGGPQVAVVDVRLQVTLGQVGALTSWYDAAHVEGAALALLDALHRVGAVVQGEARTHLISFLLVE